MQVTCTLANDPALAMRADRVRVCHVLLHSCFNNPASAVALAVALGRTVSLCSTWLFRPVLLTTRHARIRCAPRNCRRSSRLRAARAVRERCVAVDGVQASGLSRRPVDHGLHFFDQPSRIEGLRPELIEQRLLLRGRLLAAGQRNQRRAAQLRELPQALRELEAVHAGQADIDEHQERRAVFDEPQRRLRVAHALRGNVFQLQQHREAGRGVRAVIDDQDLHAVRLFAAPAAEYNWRNLCWPAPIALLWKLHAESDMATAPMSIAEGELAGVNASIAVSSPAFGPDEPIPSQYTADGEGLSPPLEWSGVPMSAEAVVLVVEDADEPAQSRCARHRVGLAGRAIRRYPRATEAMSVRVRSEDSRRRSCRLIRRPGVARIGYAFQVFALDTVPRFESQPGRTELLDKIKGHVIAKGLLIGTYERT